MNAERTTRTLLRHATPARMVAAGVLASVVLAELTTLVMSLLLHGRVRADYLVTGAVAACLVSVFVVGLLVWTTQQLRRLEAERRRMENQLHETHKLEMVGRLAGGVAHDFNNLVQVVLSYSSFLKEALQGSEVLEDVEEISRAGQRAAELTRQLLAFGRRSMVQPRRLDMNAALGALEPLAGRVLGEDVTLALRRAPGAWPVLMDPSQLDQVLMNLLVNARDAMETGGTITVETANVSLGAREAPPELGAGDYLRLVVSDSGERLEAEALAHVFEPFFTTGRKGNGLGLATVYGIVRQAGGQIAAAPGESGRGTRFTVLLPRQAGPGEVEVASAGREAPAAAPVRATGARVLLVEDEASLRRAVSRTLGQRGYQVVEAPGGEAALALLHAGQQRFDLLLTDVVMPGMSGPQLVARLREQRLALPVLYMSGYSPERLELHQVTERVGLLTKPFSDAVLLERVAGMLLGEEAAPAAKGVGGASCCTSPRTA